MQEFSLVVSVSGYKNKIVVIYDQPDCRDQYESFDFWNCEIFKVIDIETQKEISCELNYEQYKEIFSQIYSEQKILS